MKIQDVKDIKRKLISNFDALRNSIEIKSFAKYYNYGNFKSKEFKDRAEYLADVLIKMNKFKVNPSTLTKAIYELEVEHEQELRIICKRER